MNKLKNWYLLQGKRISYLVYTLVFAFFAWWFASLNWIPQFLRALVGIISLGFAYRFFMLSQKIAHSFDGNVNSNNFSDARKRVISFLSGTYNENLNIGGDYIQGDQNTNIFQNINLNQDVPSLIKEISDIFSNLAKTSGGKEFAGQKIIDELVRLMHQNQELKEKLDDWLEMSGSSVSQDEVETAERIMNIVSRKQSKDKPFWEKFIESKKNRKEYQRLAYLLRTAQWREADNETARLLKQLMSYPDEASDYITYESVLQASVQELKTINKLWLESSGGRFGFSVQQRIWRNLNKRCLNLDMEKFMASNPFLWNHYWHYQSLYADGSNIYGAFSEAVGWPHEMGRIYHCDLDYEITTPPGYLPMKVFILDTYNPKSKYCSLSTCLLFGLMTREYSEDSFLSPQLRAWLHLDSKDSLLPDWLKRWLLLE